MKERFGVVLPPFYPDFRAETDRLYPDQSIVIRDQARPGDTGLYLADIKCQRPAIRNNADFYKESFSLMVARHGNGGFMKPIHPVYDGKAVITQKVDLAYIYTDDDDIDAAESFHRMSANELPSLCMKFQSAALNPALIKWFRFYHELAHAVIALQIHTFPDDEYHKKMEEMVRDSFASLHVLCEFGVSAVPLLRTIADMRLTGFKEWGPRHFTTPGMRSIIDDFESDKFPDLAQMSSADIFLRAHACSIQNFLNRHDIEEWQKRVDRWPLEFMMGWDRYCMVSDIYCKAAAGKPWREGQARWLRESETVMNRYSHTPGLFR